MTLFNYVCKFLNFPTEMRRLQYCWRTHVTAIGWLSPRYAVFWTCIFLSLRVSSGLDSSSASIAENDKQVLKRVADPSVDLFDCENGDQGCLKDKANFDAIQTLHRMLDDDHNGNVDQSESDEFLRDELQYTDGFERQKTFHGNDKQISVVDLWKMWRSSQVFNWTVDDVLEWLETNVELPQYISVFVANAVDGSFLPRLACSNSSFFINVLGIKNAIHRQKLSLKAMDTVLFGAPKKAHGYLTDVALVGSLVVALGGCWFAYVHHRYSQTHIKKMMKDLESLQKAEDALTELQEKLEMAEQRQQENMNLDRRYSDTMSDFLVTVKDGEVNSLKVAEEELAYLRATLKRTEKQLESQHQWTVPGELQAWLQLTHEVEHNHYITKRKAAEQQMELAKDECDKIRKRNRAFFGSLRMAHSNSLDDIDKRILHARAALEEVKLDLQERLHRWHAIEQLCNFPIMSNPGIAILRHLLCRDNQGQSYSVPLSHNVAVDDADEDIPPFPTDYTDYAGKVLSTKTMVHQLDSPNSQSTHSLSLPVISQRLSRTSDILSQGNGVLFHLGDSSPSPPPDITLVDQQASSALVSSNHMSAPVSSVSRNPRDGLHLNLDNGKHIPSIPYSASFHRVNLTPSSSESSSTTSTFDSKRSVSTSGLKKLLKDSKRNKDSTDDNDLDDRKSRKHKKKAIISKIFRKVGTKPKSS